MIIPLNIKSGKVDTEIINTWDFEKVEKWYEGAMDHKRSNKMMHKNNIS
ncbi:hypothetical protein [uncultured Clostridium sp.]|nr:hypothetical protein [uncultured Clostridium sp.]